MTSPGWYICEVNVVGSDGAKTCQNLGERSYDQVLAMPEKMKKMKF